MFVKSLKPLKSMAYGLLALSAAVLAASTASAGEQHATLDVTLSGLQASDGKLFLSVQKEADFMQQRGTAGGVYEIDVASDQVYSYSVPVGDYAVSIWHDTDNDGQFSMDENYIPTDGWGMSGDASGDKEPVFEDVKINIGFEGAAVNIPMVYTD